MKHDNRRPFRVAFRADASVEIGTGHVMRCLTLADALRDEGAQCLFLCRPHEGHLLDLIADRRHEAIALPRHGTVTPADPNAPAHADWLGADWETDAEDCRKALAGREADWLIVDHYALDHRWEKAMRQICHHLLVVDDLADRAHDCDILLDQNLGRRAADYRNLLPQGAQTLIGPRYALLRPEFSALREESLARRKHARLRHLLITMGGVDKDNATGAVLDALKGCDLPRELQIAVVMGPYAPWLAQVRAQAATMPRPTQVLSGVRDMARLMVEADLAIGAAGSTSWERCCLGLPTIQLVLADNQALIADALEQASAAVTLEISSIGLSLPQFFKDKHFADRILRQGQAASLIADGYGAKRVTILLQDVR